MVSPGCSVGETVLPIVAGITPLAVMNAMEVMVPALDVSDAIVYASGTLPELAIVNVRVTGVPTGKLSAFGSTAGSLGETAIAETDATETVTVLDCAPYVVPCGSAYCAVTVFEMTTPAAGDASPVPVAAASRGTARPIERTRRTKTPGIEVLLDLDLERAIPARTRSERPDGIGEP